LQHNTETARVKLSNENAHMRQLLRSKHTGHSKVKPDNWTLATLERDLFGERPEDMEQKIERLESELVSV
jgi:hypothetical protein